MKQLKLILISIAFMGLINVLNAQTTTAVQDRTATVHKYNFAMDPAFHLYQEDVLASHPDVAECAVHGMGKGIPAHRLFHSVGCW